MVIMMIFIKIFNKFIFLYSLNIIKEKINLYDKLIMLHIFSTNISFHLNSLSKTYYKLSHSIVYLLDTSDKESIDNFFIIHKIIVDNNLINKFSVVVWCRLNRTSSISSIDIKSNSEKSTYNSNSLTNTTPNNNKILLKNTLNLGKYSIKGRSVTSLSFIDSTNPNYSLLTNVKALIKIYKLVTLYIKDYRNVNTNNLFFCNFIGYHLLNKIKYDFNQLNENNDNNYNSKQHIDYKNILMGNSNDIYNNLISKNSKDNIFNNNKLNKLKKNKYIIGNKFVKRTKSYK